MNGGMLGGGGGGFKVPALQADAVLSQANPVSGTKYTVLSASNVKSITAYVLVIWTVQPTPLELHGTVDGQTLLWSFTNPVSNTEYFPLTVPQVAALSQGLSTNTTDIRIFVVAMQTLSGRNVKIEAETTGGTVSALNARVKYGKW